MTTQVWFVNVPARVKQTLSASTLATDINRVEKYTDSLGNVQVNEFLAYPSGYVLSSGEATAANTLQDAGAVPAASNAGIVKGPRPGSEGQVQSTTVPFAATVTPNVDTTDVLNVGVLTAAITIAAPTGSPVDGQELHVRLVQDGTGGRVITWNAVFAFGTTFTAASIATTANAKAVAVFEWVAVDSKWRCVQTAVGF